MTEQEPLAEALLAAMSEAVYVVAPDRRITYWNHAAEQLTGYPAENVVGHRCHDQILNHVDDDGESLCATRCPLAATMIDGEPREMFAHLHHRAGHRVPVAVRAAPLRDASGTITGAVEVFHDDSRYQAMADHYLQAERRALTDSLTGLANRRLLQSTLHQRRDEHQRYERSFAVLFVDIDEFKSVNDRHGHPVGDEVLAMVAATLRSCTRPSDSVGRWGGEEFLVVAPDTDADEAMILAERVRTLIATSWIYVGADPVQVTVSIGVAVLRPDEAVPDIVARADHAMLAAKRDGRNRAVLAEGDLSGGPG